MRHLLARPRSYTLVGTTALVALILLLPLVDVELELPPAARISAYTLVLIPVGLLLNGLLVTARSYATPWLLALGALSAALGFSLALLVSTEDLGNGPGILILLALSAADLSRIVAAACVGISLARYVNSVGTAMLIVVAAVASDIFSVFAGPTRMLMQQDSPALDILLLVFPTFGSALGFGLGVSDIIFLTLFTAASRFLNLRYLATLLGVCSAVVLAASAGLLLERSLPALPFVALAFVLVNADLIVTTLAKGR